MRPLRVTAKLSTEIANPRRLPALDGLLACAQATFAEEREPAAPGAPVPPVDITHAVALAPCGRYHLATVGLGTAELWNRGRFVNRRFPLAEAQALGGKIGTLNLSGGPAKSFRLPLETALLEGDVVEWFALGDRAAIEDLLRWVRSLGKRRGVGLGKVEAWTVEPFDPEAAGWGPGFPVLRSGRPLRNLPLDALPPEERRPFEGYGVVTYPYFERHREELCLLPAAG